MDEGFDVAVRIASLPDSSLSAIRVGSVRRVLCASPEYLEKNGRPESPEDLADHDLIDFTNMAPTGEWSFHHGDQTKRFKPDARLRVNKASVMLPAIEMGRGISKALYYMVSAQVETGQLEIILEDYEPPALPIHVMHTETGRTSAKVRAVVDHLVEHLRQNRALSG